MKRLYWLFLLVLAAAAPARAATYYVDYGSGADTNAGTSTGSPWQHAPGMTGCTSNCNITPAAGDRIIFKGGVTVSADVVANTWTITYGGTSGHPVYIGVDKTWFTGASWTRPIWDFHVNTSDLTTGIEINADYVTLDNFEFKNFFWNGAGAGQAPCIFYVKDAHDVVENMYIHAWSYTGGNDTLKIFYGNCGQPQCGIFRGGAGYDSGGTCVITGVDASPPSTSDGHGSGQGIYHQVDRVTGCHIYDVSNGVVTDTYTSVDNNEIDHIYQSFDGSNHMNDIEMLDCGESIYNNLVHDITYVGVVTVFTQPQSTCGGVNGNFDYVYNNVCWSVARTCFNSDYNASQNPAPAVSEIFLNNTCVTSGGACIQTTDRTGMSIGTLTIENNLAITTPANAATAWCYNVLGPPTQCYAVTTANITSNTIITPSAATGYGYTASNNYATPSGSPTIGAGTNLTSQCSGTGETSLCSDIVAMMRPSSGAWDTSAYQGAGSGPAGNSGFISGGATLSGGALIQ